MREAIQMAITTVATSSTRAMPISAAVGSVSSMRAGIRYGLKKGMSDRIFTHSASGALSPAKVAK
jgi:hypothetical protein